ncbi:unnamed protein product [Durusdinium trenchii]|uniref:Uncharacterized protein n=1 Tax=Durusdinium trenchii TaxID=1381693 RepID=A0ABP0P304_9DINO
MFCLRCTLCQTANQNDKGTDANQEHEVNKYLLFLRIVLAEMFKDLRLNGWQIEEAKERMAILSRSSSHRHNSSSSVGIVMQLTRVLWDELLPQLEQQPKASRQVILTLLEPLISLSETSYVEGLVRGIHETVFKKVPWELLDSLIKRLLEAAARTDILQQNREVLYETVDELERRARGPPPSVLLFNEDISDKADAVPKGKRATTKGKSKKGSKTKVAKAKNAKRVSQVSPLMLPKAAEPQLPKTELTGKRTQRRTKMKGGKHTNDKRNPTKATTDQEPFVEPTRKEKHIARKRGVTFNPLDKVVTYSEDTPVSKMKGPGVKCKKRRIESTKGEQRNSAKKRTLKRG